MQVRSRLVSKLRAKPPDARDFIFCVAEERECWDPKDGELCLNKLKPGETLVEDCSDSDVQIDRQI